MRSGSAYVAALRRVSRRYYRSGVVNARDRIKLIKLIWDFVGTEFGGRQLQYEMFYSAAQRNPW